MLDDITPPQADECPAFPARYLVDKVLLTTPLRTTLERQRALVNELLGNLDDATALRLHPPYTWTTKQVIGHVADAERVFAYRLLCIARGETKPLPGFDENAYAAASNANDLAVPSLLAEFNAVRAATMHLLANLPTPAADRRGNANGGDITARAMAYVLAGHAEHHLAILNQRLNGMKK